MESKQNCTCCFCTYKATKKRRKPLKGRADSSGAKNGNAKLSAAKVKKIFKLKGGPYRTQWVAQKFGVDHQTIYQIWRGLIWTKVTGFDNRKDKQDGAGADLQSGNTTVDTSNTTTQAVD